MSEPKRCHRLDGLEPDNLLAFLALLGLLRALEAARPAWHPRAAWDLDNSPLRPVLILSEQQTAAAVCELVAESINRLATAHNFGDATDIQLPAELARSLLRVAAERATCGDRYLADLYAALFSDAVTDEERTRLEPTSLAYPSVATSNFLRGFMSISQSDMPKTRPRDPRYPKSPADCISQALFSPWLRLDRPVGLRWDPEEAKRHAYQWRAPTKDPPTTQHGANRLAVIGISALTAVPVQRGLHVDLSVLGGAEAGGRFTFAWPIWKEAASLASIRAILSHPQLREPRALVHLGIDHVRLTRQISLDRLRNFTTAESIAQE